MESLIYCVIFGGWFRGLVWDFCGLDRDVVSVVWNEGLASKVAKESQQGY